MKSKDSVALLAFIYPMTSEDEHNDESISNLKDITISIDPEAQ